MDGSISLMVKTVTFSQDSNSGTRSVLELCNAAALQGTAPAENR